ncbi:hypothetical protein TcasGA2_TC032902 [Tribolium castaneum]|uniref:Uncharacterized protein n=1 Tax=Tribolium castaneum TaxID=7070 RepID=A0A139WJX8_TRICA|nr:PREDICTED: zinc finger protein 791-like [Tribolium castaneum]KYB28204.1 hypothetical protein TcasGA2_TC032902 [Tribolium castaneum]|eukprot:XP_015834919.1 PREDICTED: zinc finger protein 791-like [Tribolium castaneum]
MEKKDHLKCRICLIKIEPGVFSRNIFEQTRIGLSICELLTNLTSVQFRQGDPLPNVICGVCEGKVNVVLDLYSTIVASDQELKKHFQAKATFTHQIKTEPSIDVAEKKVVNEKPSKDTVSKQRRYGCDLCSKKFSLESALKDHKRSHISKKSSKKPFKCHHCNRRFKKRLGLFAHMGTHNPQYYKIDEKFDNNVIPHTIKKLFLCEVCGKRCSTKMGLKQHSNIHKPKRCKFCNAAFSSTRLMRIHVYNGCTYNETRISK